MNNGRLRVEKAVTIALEHLEYIMNHRTAPDFVEITVGLPFSDFVLFSKLDDAFSVTLNEWRI